MRLGFIGTGTITEAVITGIFGSDFPEMNITVSPRSADLAARLAQRHPAVRVAQSNQGVVDAADIVFLAVRPQIAREVVRELTFRPEQHVVSFIATLLREDLTAWINIPVELTQAVPLPFTATNSGATAIYPPAPAIAAIFSKLGTAIEVTDKGQFETLSAASALMGTYFGMLEQAASWLEKEGLPRHQADAYLRQLFVGLGEAARRAPENSFETLRHEYSTKGGLNEQVFRDFSSSGGTAALEAALDNVLRRIRTKR